MINHCIGQATFTSVWMTCAPRLLVVWIFQEHLLQPLVARAFSFGSDLTSTHNISDLCEYRGLFCGHPEKKCKCMNPVPLLFTVRKRVSQGNQGLSVQVTSPPDFSSFYMNSGVRNSIWAQEMSDLQGTGTVLQGWKRKPSLLWGAASPPDTFPGYWGLWVRNLLNQRSWIVSLHITAHQVFVGWLVCFPSMSKWNHFLDKIILKIKNPNTLLTSSFCSSQHVLSPICQSLVQHHTRQSTRGQLQPAPTR